MHASFSGESHPGEIYEPTHPPDAILINLPVEKQWFATVHSISSPSLGAVGASALVKEEKPVVTEAEKRRLALMDARPPWTKSYDFEAIAKAVLPDKAWAYYSSASDDEITIREDQAVFQSLVLPSDPEEHYIR